MYHCRFLLKLSGTYTDKFHDIWLVFSHSEIPNMGCGKTFLSLQHSNTGCGCEGSIGSTSNHRTATMTLSERQGVHQGHPPAMVIAPLNLFILLGVFPPSRITSHKPLNTSCLNYFYYCNWFSLFSTLSNSDVFLFFWPTSILQSHSLQKIQS